MQGAKRWLEDDAHVRGEASDKGPQFDREMKLIFFGILYPMPLFRCLLYTVGKQKADGRVLFQYGPRV